MATIHNTSLIRGLIDAAKLQLSIDRVPTELAEKIVPVLVTGQSEKEIIITRTNAIDVTSALSFKTDAKKDTYIVGIGLTLSKDVVSDSTFSAVEITFANGITTNLNQIRYEPLEQNQFTENIFFKYPIKLQRNTNVNVVNSSATASIDTTATIYYYEVEE